MRLILIQQKLLGTEMRLILVQRAENLIGMRLILIQRRILLARDEAHPGPGQKSITSG